MAKVNWNAFSQQFGDAFTSTFLQTQKLAQQEAQFSQEMNFQNRQLQLGEAFRRDELAETIKYHKTYGEYLNSLDENADLDRELNVQQGIADLTAKGFQEVPEGTSSSQPIYGKSWIAPSAEQSRWSSGPQGTSVEEKYTTDPITGKETITNYETVISPPEPTTTSGSDKTKGTFDTFYNEGLSYLQELKSINQLGGVEVGAKEYNEAKQKATLNTYQALDVAFAGIDTKIILESLRGNVEGIEDPAERRRILNEAINKFDQQYELTPEQLKALKLWNETGTR